MTEAWLPIPGYEGRYMVSDSGQVLSLLTDKILKPIIAQSGGYHVVALYNNGMRMTRVNRAVLLAFVGDPPVGSVSCHCDGDPSNNRLSNLRWDTPSENMYDVVRHGNHANANKTHCPSGHEYSPDNVCVKPSEGSRRCKICLRESQQRYRSRKENGAKCMTRTEAGLVGV